jgi:hypothetical protein
MERIGTEAFRNAIRLGRVAKIFEVERWIGGPTGCAMCIAYYHHVHNR